MTETRTQTKTVDQQCSEYAIAKRREYHREYRRNHPEKVKQWRKNYIKAQYARMMEREGATV